MVCVPARHSLSFPPPMQNISSNPPLFPSFSFLYPHLPSSHPPLLHPSMAERVAPPGEKPNDPPPTDPPLFVPSTLVVQLPKEQIYRFPTAENAKLAEKYRNPAPRQRPCLAFFLRLSAFLLFVAVIIGLIAALIYLVANPGPPQFIIDSLHVRKPIHHHSKNHHRSRLPQHHHQFDLRLRSENKNTRMKILYRKGGSATLYYKGEDIGSGEPQLTRNSQRSTTFKLSLSDSNALLPKQIRKSLNGKGPKGGLNLALSVVVPVRVKVVGVSLRAKKVVGRCHVKVSKLGEKARILSQSCNVKIA